MLEFLLALLTTATVGVLLVPLLRQRLPVPTRLDNDLAIYRDQLAELERDLGRGVLTPEQADAARTEIGRRILALNPAATATGSTSAMPFATATAAVLLLPFAAWALYAALGSPSMPDQPYASRGANPNPAAVRSHSEPPRHAPEADGTKAEPSTPT